ncbi:phage tail tape measure protein [Vibrio scophthalmi]|uniref:Phage tail tape measure family protein n=1 Tax=Vibrio scophthalmi LMG 19158 TaxID=870967 RepID=F9RME1_9VIBR|nr:phage tail tape measure protein [Vibrio scophthalmi]EGU38369.1 phage tail tape measure family protein [Vibrio scophthalmi LMG 19158]
MSSELNASIRLNLTGNLTERSRLYQREMKSMARETRLSFQIMNTASKQAMRGINAGLDSMGSRYAGFAASLAGGVSFRNAITLERRMNRIGVQAEISAEQVKKLQDEVYNTAMDKDIAIDPRELLSAIEAIVTRTGDLEYARKNMEALGQAIQATGAMGGDIGGLVAELKKLEVTDVSRGLNILVAQGKAGAVEAKDLAQLGPRLLSAYAATGRQGESAIVELGAAMQVLNSATGTPDVAATTFEALLGDLQNPQKQRQLAMSGINIYEKNEQGRDVLRDLPSIMTDIVTKFDGNMVRIGMIFGDEARRGFNQISAEMIKKEQVDSFNKFAQLDVNFNQIFEDSKRIASDSTGGLQRLATSWDFFINNQLNEPLSDLASTLRNMNTETVQSAYNIGKWVAAIGGATLIMRKIGVFKGASWLWNRYRKGKNGSPLGGMGELGNMGVQRVFVVNMPGSGFGGGYGGGDYGGRRRDRLGQRRPRLGGPNSNPLRLGGPDFSVLDGAFDGPSNKGGRFNALRNSRASRMLMANSGGRVFGLLGGGVQLADVAMNGGDASDVGSAAGSMGGGWLGAKLGASIGTFIAPGLGTAIGGVLGGLVGSFSGSQIGDYAGSFFEGKPQEVQGEVKVIVEDKRTSIESVTSSSPGMNFSAYAGSDLGFFGG